MSRFKDITGKRFGKLTVEKFSHFHSITRSSVWHCVCDCGAKKTFFSNNIISGKSTSCGCVKAEKIRARSLVHGDTIGRRITPEYITWAKMKSRCLNSTTTEWHNYGGRGISICERWINSYANFISDMGRKPSPKHSIDRINNNGNYEPTNCRWATSKEQCNNMRTNRIINFNGKSMTMAEWNDALDVKNGLIISRLKRGWSIERTLTEKVKNTMT